MHIRSSVEQLLFYINILYNNPKLYYETGMHHINHIVSLDYPQMNFYNIGRVNEIEDLLDLFEVAVICGHDIDPATGEFVYMINILYPLAFEDMPKINIDFVESVDPYINDPKILRKMKKFHRSVTSSLKKVTNKQENNA